MKTTLSFLGASGTVTGSKYIINDSTIGTILIDAGLFQGPREWKEENWKEFPVDVRTINAVLITHAHIDHIGYLPRLVKMGLNCPVYLTHGSQDLAELLLIDSANIQEEEARFRVEHGVSRHKNPKPLYTVEDAKEAIKLFRSVDFDKNIEILQRFFSCWKRAGHILGASSISVYFENKIINFSGDIGRYNVPIMPDPAPIEFGDLLLIESTYGARNHSWQNPKDSLKEIINRTVNRQGLVLIPSFAVGRTQELLYYIRELKEEKSIPDIPIILDSPMAKDATDIYLKHQECFDEESKKIVCQRYDLFRPSKLHFIQDKAESIRLNSIHQPMIIISASGMLTGGRILHHIKFRIADKRNTLLFVGYQPAGGKGAWIKSNPQTVRIFGEEIPLHAEVAEISSLSAHADSDELLRWCKSGVGKPKKVAIVHGETDQAKGLAERLEKELKWDCFIPSYRQKFVL